jgi:hypothetical protein
MPLSPSGRIRGYRLEFRQNEGYGAGTVPYDKEAFIKRADIVALVATLLLEGFGPHR